MGDDFDAIVVGAGMAGCSAAIRLAQGGANVLLLERGEPKQPIRRVLRRAQKAAGVPTTALLKEGFDIYRNL